VLYGRLYLSHVGAVLAALMSDVVNYCMHISSVPFLSLLTYTGGAEP